MANGGTAARGGQAEGPSAERSGLGWAGGREPGGDALDSYLSGQAVGVPDRPVLPLWLEAQGVPEFGRCLGLGMSSKKDVGKVKGLA